jgi:hypothetical protein
MRNQSLKPNAGKDLKPNLLAKGAVGDDMIKCLYLLGAEGAIISIPQPMPLKIIRGPATTMQDQPTKELACVRCLHHPKLLCPQQSRVFALEEGSVGRGDRELTIQRLARNKYMSACYCDLR